MRQGDAVVSDLADHFVKVVINGESWGVYANVQQFNKEFLAENYPSNKGSRWKVQGSPGGGGGLEYWGDNIDEYRRRYQIKSADSDQAWRAFINLCRVLNTTPVNQLEAALRPILDVDGLLWFLALDVALINNDGYWVRASDYSLYLDEKGEFHIVPHDMNEAFRRATADELTERTPSGGPGELGLRRFAEQRRDYLLTAVEKAISASPPNSPPNATPASK